jgi:hypothetical protein
MPAIRDIPLSLETAQVLRRQGLRKRAEVRPEIRLLIQELLVNLNRSRLLEPAVACEYYVIRSMNGSQISPDGDEALHGSLLPAIFHQAKELGAILCTIGPKLEKQVTDYSKNGATLRGMILDGIGSAAVDKLAAEVPRLIATEVSSRGYAISSPVNPGMPGFRLTEQWHLLPLVSSNEIGVGLTASGVLVPRKSTSMVIGIGPHMKRWTQTEVCARCSIAETCLYKVTR